MEVRPPVKPEGGSLFLSARADYISLGEKGSGSL